MIVTSLKKEKTKDLENRIREIVEKNKWSDGIEIYTDYRDREAFENKEYLNIIFNSDNPREMFQEILFDWAIDYDVEYGFAEIKKEIRSELTDEENEFLDELDSEGQDLLREYIYFYYDEKDFDTDLHVNLMIDCGNRKYDYTCDNVLNYCGDGEFKEHSSILWLAEQFGKADKLKEVCKKLYNEDGDYIDREIQEDKFIESCVQELENASCQCCTLTFLVSISLVDLIDILEKQKTNEYTQYIVLGKETECGLFDTYNGGGSCLEIELDNDVTIPLKYVRFCVDGCRTYGYDVDEVYGLIGSCWKNSIKDVY